MEEAVLTPQVLTPRFRQVSLTCTSTQRLSRTRAEPSVSLIYVEGHRKVRATGSLNCPQD